MATSTSNDQSLEYQHFIDYQLDRAQGRMKSVEIGAAVVRLITAALAYCVVVIALDHAFVLPSGLRLLLLLAALAAGMGYLVVSVVLPGWRRINHLYAARTIEQATPEFKNSLMNFLDLRRHPEALPTGVLPLLEERAVADLSQIHVEEKINQDRLIKASYALAGAVLVTCVAVLLNATVMQRSLVDSLGRVIFPTADIQPPTQTRLTDIKPGDKTVIAHTSVVVSAIADGREPSQVTLVWSDDGRFWREQPLKKPESGSQFDPWTTELSVEKPVQYHLVGGDCRTRQFTIDVTQPPMVTDLELIYDYPEYTGWAQYTSRNGNIDALEGTTITLTAATSRPVTSGQVRFGSNKSVGPALQLVNNRTDQLTGKFVVSRNDSYVIWFVTAEGETNPRPASYEIKVRLDLPPTLTVKPGTDQIDPPVPANSIVPIGVAARDDFGLDEVKLNVGLGQETVQSFELTDLQTPGKELNTTHRLDLQKLQLNNGDEITYWVDVADNKQPKRNRISSTHYRIRLGSPLSPAERDEETQRQGQLARAEDAQRAAEAAEKAADQTQQQTEPQQKADPSDAEESAPKDERALDVIRKYLQEKDRAQTEQPREGSEQDNQDEKGHGKTEPSDGRDSKDSNSQSAQDGNMPGGDKEGEKNDEPNSKSGQESDRDDRSGSKGVKNGEQGAQQSGEKSGGEKSGDGKTKSDKAGSEKPSGQRSADGKSDSGGAGESNDTAGGEKSKQSDNAGDKTQTGQKQQSDHLDPNRSKQNGDERSGDSKGAGERQKGDGQRASGDKSSGERAKPAADERDEEVKPREKLAGDKQTGDKQGDDKLSDDKAAGDQTHGQKAAGDKGEDKAGGDKAGGDKAGGDKAGGDKAGGDKAGGDKAGGDKAGGDKAGGDKAGGDKAGGDKAGGDKAGGDKAGGDKAGGDKAGGDKAGGDKAGGDKAGGDKAGGDKAGGDKAGGDKAGGDKADGDKAGGDKAGGDKAGGDKAGGDKAGGDKAGGDKAGGDKAGGDKAGGDKAGGDKADGDKAGGDKAGGDKAGGDKAGGDKAGGDKAGGDKAGGDKAGGDKAGGDKAGGDKAGGDKAGGDKAGGDKAGGDKAGGDKAGGDKADGDKAGGDKAGEKTPGGKSGSGKEGRAPGSSQGAAGASGKSDPNSQPSGQGASDNAAGGNPTGERTENAQPGGGENPGQGPVRKNDPATQPIPTRRASTPDYSNEGSELVLDRLAKQLDRGEVDPELLKRLGWSRDELEQFVKEFHGPGDTDVDPTAVGDKSVKTKKSAERGKTTLSEKNVRSTRRAAGQTAVDTLGENYEGRRSKPAPEYEDVVRAYNMSQSKSDKPNKPASTEKPR